MKIGKNSRIVGLAVIVIPLMIMVFPSHTFGQQFGQLSGDPLGSFETAGPPAPLNWTGDGQRIINPSFETGETSPWVQIQSNARTSSSTLIINPGYDGVSSVLVTVRSGNTTSDSFLSLVSDLTMQQVAFSGSIRLRAAFYVENITGTTSSDRVEVSITLTDSTGLLKAVHYVFGGTSLPANTTSDAYFRIGGPTGQWIGIDRNVAADALARFGTVFTSLNSVRDVRLSVYSRTTGNDPKVKYSDTNSNFTWDVGEPVIYDIDETPVRSYDILNDQVVDGPAPGSTLKSDARLKFVDSNSSGTREVTEPVVYDTNANNVYDILEPVIAGSTPSLGRVLSIDAKIKYQDANGNNSWNLGEPVIYDGDNSNTYDLGERIIDSPPPGSILQDDPKIRLLDSNDNRVFNLGESLIYDSNNNGLYDAGEPLIAGNQPPAGTRFSQTSSCRFDRVELYSATGNFEWVRNNGFESGTLAGWGAYGGGFQVSAGRALAGAYSAIGDIAGGTIDMAQSLDSEPKTESWSRFKASTYISSMTGSSGQDFVDVWLGLVDSSSSASPAFVHYILKTTVGVPANTTYSEYHWINVSGLLNTWVDVNSLLQDETAYFSSSLYTPPFHLLIIGVQVSSQGTSRTTAYFDEFSFFGPYHPGPFTSGSAPSYRYALDGANSTYIYTAQSIPHGAFYIVVPSGQKVLNVTTPGGTALSQTEYTIAALTGGLRIDIPVSTAFNYAPVGDWKFYTTSRNAVATVYTEDPLLGTPSANFDPGSSANLVSQSRDPLGNPLAGSIATLTIWDSSANLVSAWIGTTDSAGWFNVSSVTLPLAGGEYRLQATVNSTYIGVLTFQFFLGPRPPTVDFTFSPGSPFTGDTVVFTAVVSGGQSPYAFSWNFGDGSTSAAGSPVSHVYSAPGNFAVTLTVTDSNSATAFATHAIEVASTPLLLAAFSFTPTSPVADTPVSFTATASGGRGPYTFYWNFGDLSTGTGSTLAHTYSTRGSYLVVLSVIDASEEVAIATRTIDVHYDLTLSLSTPTTQLSAGSSVTIAGQITPTKPGVNVTISYRIAGDLGWTFLGTAVTDTDGRFTYTWTPGEGDYELKASVGDAFTSPADSNRTALFVSPSQTPLLFLALAGGAGAIVALAVVLTLRRKRR